MHSWIRSALAVTCLAVLSGCGVESVSSSQAQQPGVIERPNGDAPDGVKERPTDCYYHRRLPDCGWNDPAY